MLSLNITTTVSSRTCGLSVTLSKNAFASIGKQVCSVRASGI